MIPTWLEFVECLADDVSKIDLDKENIPPCKGNPKIQNKTESPVLITTYYLLSMILRFVTFVKICTY